MDHRSTAWGHGVHIGAGYLVKQQLVNLPSAGYTPERAVDQKIWYLIFIHGIYNESMQYYDYFAKKKLEHFLSNKQHLKHAL